ncbi:uncharacterized protein LOC135387669 [Ornithodoros turicata]|uniref:uncharacterized protein LOC135387669 n=1 Tax=Ornithodoros turicata TaxID=34597 RepID=UPI0031396330
MPLENHDLLGVRRGNCKENDCFCPNYVTEVDDSGKPKRVLCCYCDHAPGKHAALSEIATSQVQEGTSPTMPLNNEVDAMADHWEDIDPLDDEHSDEAESGRAAPPEVSGECSREGTVWTPDALPAFSTYLSPLLEGRDMSKEQHAHQCLQLRHELIQHLNKYNLITEGSKARIRWKYNSLGAALANAYPYMMWETADGRSYKRCRFAWSLFIRRLSSLRKQRRYRQKRKVGTPAQPQADPVPPSNPVSLNDAVAELEVIQVNDNLSMTRMREILAITLSTRKEKPEDNLPPYLLREDTLTIEAELRFAASIENLELTLRSIKNIFMEITGEVPCYIAVEEYLRSRHAGHKLVVQSSRAQSPSPPGPTMYFYVSDKSLYCGREGEVIRLNSSCTLEKALVLCLVVYYVKDWSYPMAYGQLLLLLQRALAKDSPPKGCMNAKLKELITRLEKKRIL